MSALSFLYSQLFVKPPVPTQDFHDQTVIITGGNRGIGYEAARHLLRLNVARIILGVRSVSKGQAAAETLEKSTGRAGVIQVEELDVASTDSVRAFAARVSETEGRVDAVLLNAGIFTHEFVLADGYESTLTVNVINTFLLAILLVPVLRRSAKPRLSFVASDRHVMYRLPEWKKPDTFEVLSDPLQCRMKERYPISKLIMILLAKAMAQQLPSKDIVVNTFTPGYCVSGLTDNVHGVTKLALWLLAKTTARSTEVGGRTLVWAIAQGPESHGKYLNDCKVDESALAPFVNSSEGIMARDKLWKELLEILDKKHSGICSCLEPT